MTALNLLPFLMIGLLGSVHCVGMCGGIVGALSLAGAPRRQFPVAVVAASAKPQRPAGAAAMFVATASAGPTAPEAALSFVSSAGAATSDTRIRGTAAPHALLRVLAYNSGRIASYMAAGALAGGLAGSAQAMAQMAFLQSAGYWLANLMLVALGLTLAGAWHGLARLEQAGAVVWRRVRPFMKPLLPMDSLPKALGLGMLWGWVPCGMVYSVLLTAMLSGSAFSGAAVMLAFGLGTLPALLGMGLAGARLQTWTRKRGVRVACGVVVLAFGMLGLLRASGGTAPVWLDVFCLAPPAEWQR